MSALVFIVESEPLVLGAPVAGWVGRPGDGDTPVLEGVSVIGGVTVVVAGCAVVVDGLGDVDGVVSAGIGVAFGAGCGVVPCAVVLDVELSVVDWA
jgi:hypothetical protein